MRFNLQVQTTRPAVLPDTAKNWLVLNQDLWFVINGTHYVIPCGYKWNGASIPRGVWWIIGDNTEPDFWAASLVHDWLYLTHHTDRATADECIYRILQLSDVSEWRCKIIWAAVRGFGGLSAWGNKDADKEQIREIIGLIADRFDSSMWTAELNHLRGLL